MLINAQSAEQVRVAIVEDGELKDYQVEITDKNLCRGNIYRGVVANVQPSLGAGFIDIGEDRHGFLPGADVVQQAYHRQPPKDVRRPKVDQVLERGKPVLVQVTKDAVGLKGSALTTNVALAGRYLVLTPFDSVRGISRKAEDDKSRKTIRQRLGKLNLPDGFGVIVRTNGLEQNQTTLSRDLNALLRLWKRVGEESVKGKAKGRGRGKSQGPRLLYSDQDLIVQALRDFLDTNIAEVVVDDDSVYEKAEEYMRAFMPRSKTRLIRYRERLPLFTKYRLEQQIDRIYERRAPLPSGGSLVIDGTEALTAIDVNSGRSTQRGDHDESILSVNIEAANEVARQLRLRDIGGLVVVDFIDMRTRKHQAKLEKTMRDAMKIDKARYSVGRVSPNGLLEINRQRIKQALHQRTHRSCPICHGAGSIPSPEFAASTLLGKVEARVANGLIEKATVAVHPEIADALQNGHRARLVALEAELDLTIEVIAATNFSRTEERIDYKTREKAVLPKAQEAALTSSDLAHSAGPVDAEEEAEEEAAAAAVEEETPKRPRKRRRRKKSPAKTAKDKEAAAEAAAPESAAAEGGAPAEEPSGNAKPSRSRRRRRGGKRVRKSRSAKERAAAASESGPADAPPADAAQAKTSPTEGSPADRGPEDHGPDDAAPGAPPERKPARRSRAKRDPAERSPARRTSSKPAPGDTTAPADLFTQPPQDDARDWNAGLFDLESPPTAIAAPDQEKPKPRRRRSRSPKPEGDAQPAVIAAPDEEKPKPKPRRRRSRSPKPEGDAQPSHADAWQSPLSTEPPPSPAGPAVAGPPVARRSPLRRDRATVRWQWWGGGLDDADPALTGEPPAGVKDSDE